MIVSIIFGFVGLILIGIAYFLWMRMRAFIATARSTKGTVIRLVSDSEGAVAPVFKFTASNGDVIEQEDKIFSNPPAHRLGEFVDILYDPNNPRNARVAKKTNLYFAPILLAVLGVIFIGSAGLWLGLKLLDIFF